MTINERIRELRFFVGKNQQEFATQLGLKQSMLSRIENGTLEMPTDALGELFRIYQVHPNWLFFGEGDVYLNKSNVMSHFFLYFFSHPKTPKQHF